MSSWPGTSHALLGRSLDELTLAEQWRFAGTWVALELYTPERIPLRLIRAHGASIAECIHTLTAAGLDPFAFEYQPLAQPYRP